MIRQPHGKHRKGKASKPAEVAPAVLKRKATQPTTPAAPGLKKKPKPLKPQILVAQEPQIDAANEPDAGNEEDDDQPPLAAPVDGTDLLDEQSDSSATASDIDQESEP